MLVETLVLGREDRVLHHVRDLADRHHVAPLLAEFADQHVLGGVDAQRNLGLVIGQRLERRQIGVGERRWRAPTAARQVTREHARQDGERKGKKSKPLQGLIVTGMLWSTMPHFAMIPRFALWKID